MKKLQILLATAGIAALATPALAEGLSANGAVVSSYVWRGLDQSSDNPAVQGGLDYDFGNGFAIGTWESSISWAGDSPMEADLYGSYTGALTDNFGWTVGGIYYLYPNHDSAAPSSINFWEVYGGLNLNLDPVALSTKVYYSDDNLGAKTWYYTAGLSLPLTDWLSASANIGHYTFDPGVDDTDYNAGLAATWKFLTFSVMYADNDLPGTAGDPNVVGMISFKVAE